MDKPERDALLVVPVATLIGVSAAAAGSQGGAAVRGIPVFALAVALAYLIQWMAFVPAYLRRTESFYDLTGGATYVLLAVATLLLSGATDARSLLLLALVVAWAGRLALFLFRRVHGAGKDGRFDAIKQSFLRFLSAWTLQALWVVMTMGAALAAISSTHKQPLDVWAAVGGALWIGGFAIEAIADLQKSRFRAVAAHRDQFIRTGLWAWSRHPNYFGEIVLWVGVALIALPVLRGWQHVTLVSPLFVTVLLTRVSGVPILEQRADDRWGGQAEYEEYKASTPVLFPRPPRRTRSL